MPNRGQAGRGALVVAGVPAVVAGEVLAATIGKARDELAAGGRRVDAMTRRVLPAVVGAVVERVDLTDVVAQHVDLNRIVATVDLDAILARVDLVGLAEHVVQGIDLPEMIRESTGSMGSEAVRGVRIQGIEADQAVNRLVDRLMLRKGRSSSTVDANHQPTTG